MKIITETRLTDFKAWNGGMDTLQRLIELDAADALEACIDDIYPDGLTATELNDLLWFDTEYIADMLDLPELLDD